MRQQGGDHYEKHPIQPFHVIDQMFGPEAEAFYAGNALKYLMRYRDKGGPEDLAKAEHYIKELRARIDPSVKDPLVCDSPAEVMFATGGTLVSRDEAETRGWTDR